MIAERTLDRLVQIVAKGPANAEYFFEKLTSPDWIAPLDTRGFFTHPFPARSEGGTISFPGWPPGEYLARMAVHPVAQEQVVTILERLKSTDNPRVYEAVAQAAMVLPARLASRLVGHLHEGLALPHQLRLPEMVGSIVTRLSAEGFVSPALGLARELLALAPPQRSSESSEASLDWARANARVRNWQYADLVAECLPPLLTGDGEAALSLFCDLLEQAVGLAHPTLTPPDDYSCIWRPLVEHAAARADDIQDILTSAVRDAALQYAARGEPQSRAVLNELQRRPRKIFHRVALFVLSQQGEAMMPEAATWIDSAEAREDPWLQPELDLVTKRFFGLCPRAVQQRYFEWTAHGPDLSAYRESRQRWGVEPTDADAAAYRERWTRDRLALVADHLPAQLLALLATLERTHGVASRPEAQFQVSSGWRGEVSPLSETEVSERPWSTLIEFAQSWEPAEEFDGPSTAGLVASLQKRVIDDPVDAARHLAGLATLDAQFTAGVLGGFREAIKGQPAVRWADVLTFALEATSSARTTDPGNHANRWVRLCSINLADSLLSTEPVPLTAADGKVVWALIQAAADDPDPSPEHEAQFGGANMDPATLSLNTVRAEAIHCAVRYALWRLRQRSKVEPGGPGSTQEFQGFDTVRSLLEQHLDIAIDPSLGVRAVYGQWFPWLVVLDSAWAASKVEAIFPPDIDARPWFGASWGTYIKYCAPYSNVLPILRGTYAAAIEMLNTETAEPLRDRFADNLGEHLLAYYWRGEVTLDPSDLVAAFFRVADAKERRKALEWVGWTLMRAEAPLPEQAASRLQSLWDWRWSADDRVQEGAAFSGWFASGRLDPTWSLDRLTKLLEANVLPDPDHIVVGRLASMSTATPLQRVRLVRSMVELARKGWSISAWIDDAKSTIETALESSDSAAKEEAARLIDRLGAIGFRGLRDLSRKSI